MLQSLQAMTPSLTHPDPTDHRHRTAPAVAAPLRRACAEPMESADCCRPGPPEGPEG